MARKTARALGVVTTAVALVAISAGGAQAKTLVVDNDLQQCKNAGYQAITAAVEAAGPGDKISVCPGLYTETVVVDEPNLRLQAKGTGARDCFDETPASADPSRDAIVTAGPQNTAFRLQADGIRLRGFVVQGNNVAIRTSEAFSGYRIRDNLSQRNDFGLMLGSSGEEKSRVQRNCFRNNGRGPIGAGVFGVAALAGLLENASITHNSFFANTFGLRFGASSDVTVAHNRSLQDDVWMRNGGTVDLRVVHNEIGPGALDAIVFFPLGGTAGGAPSSGAVVSHNEISGRGRDGVQVLPSGLVDSMIGHNKVSDNGRDGIRIEAGGNSGNLVEHNKLNRNREHDCHDDTVGSGTAGTANVWMKNKGETENRPGLCRNTGAEIGG